VAVGSLYLININLTLVHVQL